MEDRGTLSMELIFTTLFFIFILTGMVSVVSDRLDVTNRTEELLDARMLVETVANSINNVYTAGNGQNMDIVLPPTVGNSSYKLLVNSSGVYIEVEGMKGKAAILPMKIRDGLSNTSHKIEMLPGRTYSIKNEKIDNQSVIIIFSK